MRRNLHAIRFILAGSVALSWFAFVRAETPNCGLSEETVIIQPETTTYRIIPGEYEWINGEVDDYTLEYRVEPAKYETIKNDPFHGPDTKIAANGEIFVQERNISEIARQRIALDSYPIAKFVPAIVKDGRTRVQLRRPTYEAVRIPAQTKTLTRAAQCQNVSSEYSGR